MRKKEKKIQVRTFQQPYTRKIRHCRTCTVKCDRKLPIVGCESIYVPVPPLKYKDKTYGSCCVRRVWFNERYEPVDFWRDPTQHEFDQIRKRQLTGEEWQRRLRKELEAMKVGTG